MNGYDVSKYNNGELTHDPNLWWSLLTGGRSSACPEEVILPTSQYTKEIPFVREIYTQVPTSGTPL